ncbi:hypothetical protein NDU88_000523 [Pleurodeles waltl]|uniref:Uncharacterized protein n=1 Tax=Pleurodeles waltl TaxID=8319 RepID=A0AAV7KPM1_PLEWA|nr:hypothetical protein NDU88_000523 [Pleurodeles waltl]
MAYFTSEIQQAEKREKGSPSQPTKNPPETQRAAIDTHTRSLAVAAHGLTSDCSWSGSLAVLLWPGAQGTRVESLSAATLPYGYPPGEEEEKYRRDTREKQFVAA